MNVDLFLKALFGELKESPRERWVAIIKERLKHLDQEKHGIANAYIEAFLSDPEAVQSDINQTSAIVLIHGIRDRGNWQDKVKRAFEADTNITVIPVGYGFFIIPLFLFPFFRRNPQKELVNKLESAISKYEASEIGVICHSFGTYLVSRILKEREDIKFSRLIFCGGIVSEKYDWASVSDSQVDKIVNDCGASDFLPWVAKNFSWGFGASGLYGFRTSEVTDRYHDFGHSGFFQRGWVNHFWKPFFKDGTIVDSSFNSERKTSYLLELLNLLPYKSTIFITLVFYLFKPCLSVSCYF